MTTTDRVLETTTADVRKRCDELEAEVKRLREGLRHIAEMSSAWTVADAKQIAKKVLHG